MKIVSLIPSATEIVSALNLKDNLVGISHECDYPKEVLNLPKLTTSRIKTEQSSLKIDNDIKKILEQSLSVYEVKSDLLLFIALASSLVTFKDCLALHSTKKSMPFHLKTTSPLSYLPPSGSLSPPNNFATKVSNLVPCCFGLFIHILSLIHI